MDFHISDGALRYLKNCTTKLEAQQLMQDVNDILSQVFYRGVFNIKLKSNRIHILITHPYYISNVLYEDLESQLAWLWEVKKYGNLYLITNKKQITFS